IDFMVGRGQDGNYSGSALRIQATLHMVVPPGPPLGFAVSGQTLYLSWPITPSGFELEVTSGALGTSWSRVSNVVVSGSQKIAPAFIGSGEQYFRQKKP